MSAFFELHRDLPREGPGIPADVRWALEISKTGNNADIFDAACGPGADLEALLDHVPQGTVTGVDLMAHFVLEAAARHPGEHRLRLIHGDMMEIEGQFDFIWCAGAMYFPGLRKALSAWAGQLRSGGCIAFSYPCYFSSQPSDRAQEFWEGELDVPTQPALATQIAFSGYTLKAARRVSDAAWRSYYDPLLKRGEMLRTGADALLQNVLDEAAREASNWAAVKEETGYLLCVVTPT